eukprot:7387372-Prymnesium_polylepis.1
MHERHAVRRLDVAQLEVHHPLLCDSVVGRGVAARKADEVARLAHVVCGEVGAVAEIVCTRLDEGCEVVARRRRRLLCALRLLARARHRLIERMVEVGASATGAAMALAAAPHAGSPGTETARRVRRRAQAQLAAAGIAE